MLDVKPLSTALGAEIVGLDLAAPLDGATIAALRAALLDNLVLVFRGQAMEERDQVRFASCFGKPVGSRSAQRRDDGDPRVMLIGNVRENGEPIGALPDGELMFHSDSTFLERPLMGATLYGCEIPSTGGDTLFANMYLAYESLPDDVRTRIDPLRALHCYDYFTQVRTGAFDRKTLPHATHPAVRAHPETGRRALYVNRLMTEELVGLPARESAALLDVCFAHAERPEHVYRHVWREGDLVLWDNRCTQHARTDFPAHERRLLRRVGIDRPACAAHPGPGSAVSRESR